MKVFYVIGAILFLSNFSTSQENREAFKLYKIDHIRRDTTLFCTVIENLKSYSFVLPQRELVWYEVTDSLRHKYDTIREKNPIISYGPYQFANRGQRIVFKDRSLSNKFRVLYYFDNKEYLAPDLFSTSTDSYSEITSFVDANGKVFFGKDSIRCYKFLQKIKRRFDYLYQILYIEKKTLLPFRMEIYEEKALRTLITTIYAYKDG